MAGVFWQGIVVLVTFFITFFILSCSAAPQIDQCTFKGLVVQPGHNSLYSNVCDISRFLVDPDFDLLFNELFMRWDKRYTEVRFGDIKANLEASPITIFSNLSLTVFEDRCGFYFQSALSQCEHTQDVNLGEFITQMMIETYTNNFRNSSAIPEDLNEIESFQYDKTKWTMAWLKQKLIRGLIYSAQILGKGTGRRWRQSQEVQALIQSNDINNVLKVIGELANAEIRTELNLGHLNQLKPSPRDHREFQVIFLREEVINTAVDCWYESDGFYHSGNSAEGKIPLLQAMVEVVPKDTVKEVFRNWRTYLENRNDLEVSLDKIIIAVDEKIQEFDMERFMNLFKVRMENVIEEMQLGNGELLQRVGKFGKMAEKAVWRMRSGLWPEMINFLDRIILAFKEKDINENDLTFWKHLDNLLSPTYHDTKMEYQAWLITAFFPTSNLKIQESGHGVFWNYPYVRNFMQDLLGKVKLLVDPRFDILSEALKFTRKINVVESEKWIEREVYEFLRYLIETSIGGAVSGTHWTLQDGLAALERKGFTSDFFLEDNEKIPRELEAFMEVDWQTYFVYFMYTIAETYIDHF